MSGGHGVRVVLAASLACWGCDGLSERPGHDFALRVLDDSPIEAAGKIYAPVRFAVDGCGAFDLALENESGTRWPLTFAEEPDGTLVASVPVASLLRCFGSVTLPENQADAALVATCHDAGRTASAPFSLRTRLEGWPSFDGDIRAVFPSAVPGVPWWIATSEYGGEVALIPRRRLSGTWAPALNPAAYRNSLVRPRVATRGTRAFATLGCDTGAGCPEVAIGPGEWVPGERLAEIVWSDDPSEMVRAPRAIAHVSKNVVDMAFADDGALVVVTDSSVGRGPPQFDDDGWIDDDALRWGETIVWRIVPAPEGTTGVVEDVATIIARMPLETVATRLARTASGPLSFATLALTPNVMLKLHVTDGSSVTTSWEGSTFAEGCGWEGCLNWLHDPTFVNPGVHLSPDGSIMIMTFRPEPMQVLFWIDTATRFAEGFGYSEYSWTGAAERAPIYYQFAHGGAAWLPGALALWTGGDIMFPGDGEGPTLVQVFDAAPPHSFRWEYSVDALPGATTRPILVAATTVGDKLVLTTSTGVRVLDGYGNLVGGVDPLPCGATTTAAAEQIGPTTVAFGAGDTVVRLEVHLGP